MDGSSRVSQHANFVSRLTLLEFLMRLLKASAERHLLVPALGRAMGRHASALRTSDHGLQQFQPMAEGGRLGSTDGRDHSSMPRATDARQALGRIRVARELDQQIAIHGKPKMIVSDNGTDFTSNAMLG
jgi:hypothetical protein